MQIVLAKSSGFCFGVRNAVQQAERVANQTNMTSTIHPVYMFGPITHNEFVVQSLIKQGMILATEVEDIQDNSKVVIRAHGISPQIRGAIQAKGCEILDCTCPFVEKIHQLAKDASANGAGVLIIGTPGHPEVEGILGEVNNNGIVISCEKELENIDFGEKSWVILAQTTFSAKEFKKIRENIKNKIAKYQIFDTICSTTENRQQEAMELAKSSDYMIVIGSSSSSNTMKLFEVCQSNCEKTFLISDASDFDRLLPILQTGKENSQIGITAGASTPECIIREVIRTMSENETMSMQEQTDFNFGDYIDNIPQLRKNATVKGAITSADNEYVYVDVHDKSEGRIPRHEFINDPDFDLEAAIAEHREIEVYVRSVRNSDMGKEILLSKAHVDFGKYKAQIEEAYESKQPITVKVTSVVKDGVIATLGGVDIYIHRTQLDMATVEDLNCYKGQPIEILVTQFDSEKRRLRVSGSRRVLLNNQRKALADEIWDKIQIGNAYEGTVRSLTDFGAFVDIGGVDGLVHVSELSWNRIRHPSEVVKVGDKIIVTVKEFDPEKKRISLGYKKQEEDPYFNIEERFPVGSIAHGKVVRMFQFGAFIELAPGLDALCHISQISDFRLTKPQDVLTEGMEVDARVLEVSNEARRISISIKEVEAINPANMEIEESTTEDKNDFSLEEMNSQQSVGFENSMAEQLSDFAVENTPTEVAIEADPEVVAEIIVEEKTEE